MKNNKKIILSLWLILLIAMLFYYLYNPDFFTQKSFDNFLKTFGDYILIAYIFISIIRGFLFIPSTVLIFAGALFLNPITLFSISILGIIVSSSIVYFFSDFLGINKILEQQFGDKKIKNLEHKINSNGFIIVAIWSFLPIVPTDLICYVAGITKMKYYRFLAGLIIGEAPLVLLYVLISYGLINQL